MIRLVKIVIKKGYKILALVKHKPIRKRPYNYTRSFNTITLSSYVIFITRLPKLMASKLYDRG